MAESAEAERNRQNLERLIELGIALSAEEDIDRLVERILLEAKRIANADGGTIYLMDEEEKALRFTYIHNDTLNIAMGGSTGKAISFPPLKLYHKESGRPNHNNVATHTALTGEVVNIRDAYDTEQFDFSGTRKFDKTTGYRSKSFLTVPLKGHENDVIGVLQLINARNAGGESIAFREDTRKLVESLAFQAAISIDNKRLIQAQKRLMESFVEILARAIDDKSPYTGAHCQRVPDITKMLATAAAMETEGPLADFDMAEDDWYALHLASWLHDCGKVTTPEYISDKATKLETVHNRIHEIRTRFEVLYRDAEIAYLQGRLSKKKDQEALKKKFQEEIRQLKTDYAFVAGCNAETYLPPEKATRLDKIAERTWTRHFDRKLGLSRFEQDRLEKIGGAETPGEEKLLEDREDLKVGGYDRGELHNLKVERGTLNAEERRKINDHIVKTQEMLDALPFPAALKNVPEFAANHHERMDGKGYPRGLKRDEMSVASRIMGLADVFEAITATDKPYKKPKKLSEAIRIMDLMKRDGHVDPDIFHVFLKSGVYREYAEKYMREDQLDEVDIRPFLTPASEPPPSPKKEAAAPAKKAAPVKKAPPVKKVP